MKKAWIRNSKRKCAFRELSVGGRQQQQTPNSPLSSPAERKVSRSGIPVIEEKCVFFNQIIDFTNNYWDNDIRSRVVPRKLTFRLFYEAVGFFYIQKLCKGSFYEYG